nr:MAG TPA: hypothetical protein [Caudoviricetes sp.]
MRRVRSFWSAPLPVTSFPRNSHWLMAFWNNVL